MLPTPRVTSPLSNVPSSKIKISQFRGIQFAFTLLILAISLAACTPIGTNTPPPSNPTQAETLPDALPTSLPPELIASASPLSPSNLLPTQTPESTPTPTQLPTPGNTHMGIELVGGQFVSHVPLVADLGTGWVRFNGLSWANIEPQEGVRNWGQATGLEARAQAVSDAGMNLIAIIVHAPSWAQAVPGYACGAVLPEKLEAYGRFMYDLVARYSQPPYNIKYWELGNEPDIIPTSVTGSSLYGCWGNQEDAYYGGSYYAEMLKVVYPQIKAADPNAQVLVGGLLLACDPSNPPLSQTGEPQNCLSTRFMEGILQAGGGDYFDGISFHAYDYYWANSHKFGNAWRAGANLGLPVVYYKSIFLRDLLAQYGYFDKFLMNTETAILCGRDLGEIICQTDEFNQLKANYVVQSYAVARGEGLQANIWYHYERGWRASGLVSSPSFPYPALEAYRFVAQMLDATVPITQILDYQNLTGYKFIKVTPDGNQEIWILWSADGNPTSVILPELPHQIYDKLGQPQSASQTLEITADVRYIVWDR